MKKLLITAGGTAIAWHLCEIAHMYFRNEFSVHICDTHEPYLVPASVFAEKTHRVPVSDSPEYLAAIDRIIDNEQIDAIIPLLPVETFLFASDAPYIKKKKIATSLPPLQTARTLCDKARMGEFLERIGIPTPHTISAAEEVKEGVLYFAKPRLGFGSNGVEILSGRDILNGNAEKFRDRNYVVQEYCKSADYDEVTVEVFHRPPQTKLFARRRVETKAGVCVKTELVDEAPFRGYLETLTRAIPMPTAFNVQFLRHNGVWKLFDCNLRLGAGTALATAAGFRLTQALLSVMCGQDAEETLFRADPEIKSILRVYREIVIK